MSQHLASIVWQRGEQVFSDNQYSCAHEWQFDGGLRVPASSAPSSVPLPMSVAENVDPEEAVVAALASCHMLFFLAFACKKATSLIIMKIIRSAPWKNERNRLYLANIVLQPKVTFSGDNQPTRSDYRLT
jgi:organic hydroperoxide reductase OsmC/OhrA